MSKIIGRSLSDIPWEERPEGCEAPMWRYRGNPIIGKKGNKVSNAVFNSGVVLFAEG